MSAPASVHESDRSKKYLAFLSLSALGIVFGDIGTSPLYAIRECFNGEHALPVNEASVLGVLSLIFWSVTLVITLKYMILVLKADNNGEGGILALMALVYKRHASHRRSKRQLLILVFGIFGSALLYGDGAITPAISVLSAIEGLKVATPIFESYVVPITIGILVVLFSFQKHGTGRIATFFGPIMVLWFLTLGGLGLMAIAQNPSVFKALNPFYAVDFFLINKAHGWIILGSIFLVVTGGEAVYADMGHFGKTPIRLAWFLVAMPGLVLNYFGQGALILSHPNLAESPFFYMVPRSFLYPVVILAAIATIIASQAVISGVFSLTRQAVMLGYFPRVSVRHTSSKEIGQVYIPLLNWLMFIVTIFLVIFFQSSSALAAAYGIAISVTMLITTVLVFELIATKWKVKPIWSYSFLVVFVAIDLSFLSANSVKFMQGGWFPIVLGLAIFTVMSTWSTGREILKKRLRSYLKPLKNYVETIDYEKYNVATGTAIYLNGDETTTAPAFIHNLKHNQVIHKKIIFLTIQTEDHPYIENSKRVEVHKLRADIYQAKATYGFIQSPNVLQILELMKPLLDYPLELDTTTFFIGHESVIPTEIPGMAIWREKLFAIMSRNQLDATDHFKIPRDHVVEIGIQVAI